MITVFTPSYNRANTLPRLYESLLKQKSKNFEWIIVDDGSTDNTKQIVEQFIKEKKININYVRKENEGKHIAINKGLDLAKGEWFFIVDSDDMLIENSLLIVERQCRKLEVNCIGFAGRRIYNNGIIIGDKFTNDEFLSNHLEKTYKLKLKGDLAEVIKTDILRNYKFPYFLGEKFCAESLVWNRLAKDGYKILFTNTPTYIGEYLEGGLTDTSIKNRRNSPSYALLVYKELAEANGIPLVQKIKAYTNYWRFSFFNKLSFIQNLREIRFHPLGIISIPLGWLMKIKDNRSL